MNTVSDNPRVNRRMEFDPPHFGSDQISKDGNIGRTDPHEELGALEDAGVLRNDDLAGETCLGIDDEGVMVVERQNLEHWLNGCFCTKKFVVF